MKPWMLALALLCVLAVLWQTSSSERATTEPIVESAAPVSSVARAGVAPTLTEQAAERADPVAVQTMDVLEYATRYADDVCACGSRPCVDEVRRSYARMGVELQSTDDPRALREAFTRARSCRDAIARVE